MDAKTKQVQKMIWTCRDFIAERAARAYIAGPELQDAMRACYELLQSGFGCTISYWNSEGESTRQVADAYLAALEAIKERSRDCYLSIKLPGIDFSNQLLAEVLQVGKRNGVRVHFDSLGPETVTQTWSKISEALLTGNNIGCVLPGRWLRSLEDAEWAVKHDLIVRVVKGQWVDPDDPNIDMRAGFLRVIDCLAGRARYVGVASHDVPLAEEAITRLKAAGTPCEVELLYGLPARGSIRMARRMRVGVRFYVPYGKGWLPYCLSWAWRNPHVFWWMIKDFIMSGSSRNMG
jgi:proline dehydrogenase